MLAPDAIEHHKDKPTLVRTTLRSGSFLSAFPSPDTTYYKVFGRVSREHLTEFGQLIWRCPILVQARLYALFHLFDTGRL